MARLLQKMEQNTSPISDHSSITNMNNFGNSFEASTSTNNSISTSFNVPSISPSSQNSFIDASSANHLNAMSTSFNNLSLDFLQFSQPNVLENNVYNCPIQENYYIDDTNNYDLEGLNFDPPSSMETCDLSHFDFQTSGSGWMIDNMANNTLWNIHGCYVIVYQKISLVINDNIVIKIL
ncbi:unnamed protein product [Trifolium pratense]|uniref:Uncharacterized protein n=1 Tax=Trifolium pratense TaxID=57577 RepID=A0ACB0IF90_TRIPR|nr:unnamed protein product [Trifolium pratense]